MQQSGKEKILKSNTISEQLLTTEKPGRKGKSMAYGRGGRPLKTIRFL